MPIAVYGVLTQEQLDLVKIELGIPARLPIIHFRYDLRIFKPDLPGGWNLDIFGVRSDLLPAGTLGMLHKQALYQNTNGSLSMVVGRRPEGFDNTHQITGEVELFVFSQRLSRPPSPAYAEEYWHPELGRRRRYGGQDQPGGTDASHLTRCFEMFENLRDFRFKGRPPTTRESKIEKLARAGLDWLKANRYHQVEDVGRPQLGEATNGDAGTISKLMERRPKIVNSDVHQRMHEILESGDS